MSYVRRKPLLTFKQRGLIRVLTAKPTNSFNLIGHGAAAELFKQKVPTNR